MNLYDFLQTIPAFRTLTPEELDVLERALVVREYPPGHEFFGPGRSGRELFIIIEGSVAVVRTSEHAVVELKRLHTGELFGLLALIDHGRRAAACRAVGPVRVASLPRSAFELLYRSRMPMSDRFVRIVAQQLVRDFRDLSRMLRAAVTAELPSALERRTGRERTGQAATDRLHSAAAPLDRSGRAAREYA